MNTGDSRDSQDSQGRRAHTEKRLPVSLEARLRAMGDRWDYAPDELVWVIEAARLDPAGWLEIVAADEALGFELFAANAASRPDRAKFSEE